MWMRTLVNYQYKNGGTFMEAFYALYADGGTGARARATAPKDHGQPLQPSCLLREQRDPRASSFPAEHRTPLRLQV